MEPKDTLDAMIDDLQTAFEKFIVSGDETAMIAAVRRQGGRAPDPELDCPIAHRICDIELLGSPYRVVRVFDPDDESTQLFIYPTSCPSFDQPGDPIGLQGEALRRWVTDELENPTTGPVDWTQYDPALVGDAHR